jgi:hypothetical protein
MRRPDGVDVELDGGAYNTVGGPAREVPHDIAHLIVEHEFGLARGVWGVLADGGLFRGAAVVAGRRRPHAARLGRDLVKESGEHLNQAEILTRAVCDQAAAGRPDLAALRAAAGQRWWSASATEPALVRAIERLRHAGERWARLDAGGSLEFTWEYGAPRRR